MKGKIFEKLKKRLPGIRKNVLLKNYTTFKIGGRAKYFFVATTKKDLIKTIETAKNFQLPFFVLGGGSNLLISDDGFNGLAIKIKNCKPSTKAKLGVGLVPHRPARSGTGTGLKIVNCKVNAEAGVPLNKLVSISVRNSLTGMEWAAGIPGTIGGAIYGNAGAFGKSMADVVKKVEVLEFRKRSPLKSRFLKNNDCKFGYRDSIFKRKKNLMILSVEIQLEGSKKKEIQKKIKEYLNYKKKNQPLNYPSAGSIFKNFTPYRPARSGTGAGLKIDEELLGLIKEEVNVKEIIFDDKIKEAVELDTKITSGLKEEGIIREVVRNIQELRKKANLKPKDKIVVIYLASPELNKILEQNKNFLLKEAKVKDLISRNRAKKPFDAEKETKVDGEKLSLGIKKI